jgi:hypothetical protein
MAGVDIMDDWVQHYVEEERQRSAGEHRAAGATTHEKAQDRLHFQNLVDSLRTRVERDVEAFGQEFPELAVTFEATPLDGGFRVRREHYPTAVLTVEPSLDEGGIVVQYVFASQSGTSRPSPTFLELAAHATKTSPFRNEPEHLAFRTTAQLSEYLLVPVFSGRPR